MGLKKNGYMFLVVKAEGKDNFENPGVYTIIILKWILNNKHFGKVWNGFIYLNLRTSGGLLWKT